jgi:hypothetical protein
MPERQVGNGATWRLGGYVNRKRRDVMIAWLLSISSESLQNEQE